MKVYIDSQSLLDVAADKGIGLSKLSRQARMSPETIKRIFGGLPVLLATATRLYKALDSDRRIRIWYDADNTKSLKGSEIIGQS